MAFFPVEEQKQRHLALVHGDMVVDRPEDLYIPPEALEIFLESFEGPLDFLLYLIKKQKFDILELPIMQITKQYMQYVELMKEINLELAGEYLVMAAILAEIKSRILLPVNKDAMDEEDDPRAELVRQLLEYEKFKRASAGIDSLPRLERDRHLGKVQVNANLKAKELLPEVDLRDLLIALQSIQTRSDNFQSHQVRREVLSTRARMSRIIETLNNASGFSPFSDFFDPQEGRQGVVVTFLAILELVKEQIIDLRQTEDLGLIYIKLQTNSAELLERIF